MIQYIQINKTKMQKNIDISYLKPSQKAFKLTHSEFYIKSGQESSLNRNVFEKVKYDNFEEDSIKELKIKIIMNQVKPSFDIKDSDYLKMLVSAKFNKEIAYANTLKLFEFVTQMHTLTKEELEATQTILQSGVVYLYGSDKQYRPLIIIRMEDSKLPIKNYILALNYLLNLVKTSILVPYYVEKWTILFDMNFQSFTQLEILEAQESIADFQIFFCGNLNCILLVNCSDDVADLIKLLQEGSDITKFIIKIKVCKQISELLGYISTDQLEQRYGGLLVNLTKFWPPSAVPKQQNNSLSLDEFISEYQKKKDNDTKGMSEKFLQQLKSNSHVSLDNSSFRKNSQMKIVVLEENGNALIEQNIDVSDEDFEKDLSEDESLHASEFQAFTIKQESEIRKLDKKLDLTTTKAFTKVRQQSEKSQMSSKTKKSEKLALEGESNSGLDCCQAKQCCIF